MKSYLAEGDRYYIYVTANINENAVEFTGNDSSFQRNAVGAKLNSLTVGENIVDMTYVTQVECSREILKERQLMYLPYDGYSKFYRIPGISMASDGTLIATSDARKYHNHDIRNDFDVLSRRSTDQGRTWSDHIIIAKGSGLESGEKWLFDSLRDGLWRCCPIPTPNS